MTQLHRRPGLSVYQSVSKREIRLNEATTYNLPRQNIQLSSHLFFALMWRFLMTGRGMARMTRSSVISVTLSTTYNTGKLTVVPTVPQFRSMGLSWMESFH